MTSALPQDGEVVSITFGGDRLERAHVLWFASANLDGQDVDWLAIVGEAKGVVVGTYRFRYHASSRPFDDDDHLSWYRCEADPSFGADEDRRRMIAGLGKVAAALEREGWSVHERVELGGELANLSAWLLASPNTRARVL